MEVETGKRQLINLSRRAAEMMWPTIDLSRREDLIDDFTLGCVSETEAHNEVALDRKSRECLVKIRRMLKRDSKNVEKSFEKCC